MSKVKCYNCNQMGHFSKDCHKPQWEHKQMANLAVVDDTPALLLAEHYELAVVEEAPAKVQADALHSV
ncbi:hypothetical protein E2562_024697 [Oryza meyeriana var. granulata]|uniref:CCHC-type domain-containing protein n=1 Tax=Oryza meyeriana var. granulata TaxID=110450 RepID=A0A6G1C8P5_9ORYZ|nr:hypothetical protein E2562_024697 [Oryza meyeriana var. granulata]